MAKKSETSLPLEKMIPSYGKLKAQITEDDKAAKLLNTRIKDALLKQGLTEKSAGGYQVKYTTRTTESFNEEQLLDFCKEHKVLKGCVRTVEVIDMNELENLMYEQKIPKKLLLEMDKMRIKKDTAYLTVSKIKE